MSHVATVEIEIKDLDALAEAVSRIGMELVRGQQTYRCWYTEDPADADARLHKAGMTKDELMPPGFSGDEIGKCSHALRVRGDSSAFELGIAPRRDGRPGYVLLWDEEDGCASGRALLERVGAGCRNLKREYAFSIARKTAIANGFIVNELRRADGSIQLQLRK